eukprot:6735592-Prymnesium_polylepis.1
MFTLHPRAALQRSAYVEEWHCERHRPVSLCVCGAIWRTGGSVRGPRSSTLALCERRHPDLRRQLLERLRHLGLRLRRRCEREHETPAS